MCVLFEARLMVPFPSPSLIPEAFMAEVLFRKTTTDLNPHVVGSHLDHHSHLLLIGISGAAHHSHRSSRHTYATSPLGSTPRRTFVRTMRTHHCPHSPLQISHHAGIQIHCIVFLSRSSTTAKTTTTTTTTPDDDDDDCSRRVTWPRNLSLLNSPGAQRQLWRSRATDDAWGYNGITDCLTYIAYTFELHGILYTSGTRAQAQTTIYVNYKTVLCRRTNLFGEQ